MLRLTRSIAAETGSPISRWPAACLELRRQRQNPARRPFRADIWIQPAAGDAGGALGAALAAYHRLRAAAAPAQRRLDVMQGAYLGPAFSQAECERRFGRRALASRRSTTGAAIDRTAARFGRGKGRRLVPGADGIRSTRAWRPLDSRRCRARPTMQKDAQSQGQVPGELPAVRAGRAARGCRRLVRIRRRQSLHAAGRRRARKPPPGDDGGRESLVRHRQAQRRRAPTSRPSPTSIIRRASRPFTPKPIRAFTPCCARSKPAPAARYW